MNTPSPIEHWLIRHGPDPALWPRWTRWRYRRLIRQRPYLANELDRLTQEEIELHRAFLPDRVSADLAWLASIPQHHAQAMPDAEPWFKLGFRLLPTHYAAGAISAAASLVLGFYLGLISSGPVQSHVDAEPLLSYDELLTVELLKEGGA
ncbi:MAG: hypothetical protein WBV19_06995 [Candidatus Macondimonas sp.]|jgi:hypothetical protein